MVDFKTLQTYARVKSAADVAGVDRVLERVLQLVASAVRTAAARPVDVEIVEADWPGADAMWSENPGTIWIGRTELRRLDDACLGFAAFLLANYVAQNVSLGPALPLSTLIGAEAFPNAALQLYAGNMLARAAAPDGTLRGDAMIFGALLASSGDALGIDDLRAMHGAVARPMEPFDPVRLQRNAGAWLRDEPYAHFVLLYGRLLWDTLSLCVAHEAAHIVLGHLDASAGSPQRTREEECEADGFAVTALAEGAGFNVRSGALLFAFLAANDRTDRLALLSHPLAADRLGVLIGSNAVLDERVRHDLDAGFALLRSDIPLTFSDDGVAPIAGVRARAASSLRYAVTLEIDIPGGPQDKPNRLDMLEPPWDIEVALTLRERVNPDVERRSGSARIAAAGARTMAIGPLMRLTFECEAPPSWWLDLDSCVLKATALMIWSCAPHREAASDAEQPSEPARFSCATALDAGALIAAFDRLAEPAAPIGVLAARRALAAEPVASAAALAQRCLERFAPHDLRLRMWLAAHALDGGRYDRAIALLAPEMRATYLPPGMRGQLAAAIWQQLCADVAQRPAARRLEGDRRAAFDRAADLASREAAATEHTPESRAATNLLAAMVKSGLATPLFTALFAGAQTNGKVRRRLTKRDTAGASRLSGDGAKRLEAAIGAGTASVFIYQSAAEMRFAWAALGKRDFTASRALLQHVIDADPSFAPAYARLAHIFIEQRDFIAADNALIAAERIDPGHSTVRQVRKRMLRETQTRREQLNAAVSAATAQGDLPAALERARQLQVEIPHTTESEVTYGSVCYRIGNLAAARDVLGNLFSRGVDIAPALTLAQTLLELGELDEGWKVISIVLGSAAHELQAEIVAGETTGEMPYSNAKERAYAQAIAAALLAARGKCDEAVTRARNAAANFSGGLSLLDCAQALLASGLDVEAKTLALAALQSVELPLPPRLCARARGMLAGDGVQLLRA